jgi:hypothetical protein
MPRSKHPAFDSEEMMERQQYFIAERVQNLAALYLGRIPCLIFTQLGDVDTGFDLLAVIKGDKPGVRQFGVELRGTWEAVDKQHADRVLRPAFAQLAQYGGFPFPVFLMYFTMQNSQGWFSWISRPTDTAGKAGLDLLGKPSCEPLNDKTIAQAVEEIDAWWDRFYKSQKVVNETR